MNPNTHLTAGEISRKIMKDRTKYNALEVGHAMIEEIDKHIEESIENHLNYLDFEGKFPFRLIDEFCVVMVIAKDPLIKNVIRRKFYCSPFLPSPRPNQAVFEYSVSLGRITKRLWVLPSDIVMAEIASLSLVDRKYKTMQAWSIAFFSGTFWEYIRHESGTKMLSQYEYLSQHRQELIEAGCKLFDPDFSQPFDFDKIQIKKVIDSQNPVV